MLVLSVRNAQYARSFVILFCPMYAYITHVCTSAGTVVRFFYPLTFTCVRVCLWCGVMQAAPSTTSLAMSSVDGMIGVSTEAGGAVFDPLGLAELHSINPLVNPHPKVHACTVFLRSVEVSRTLPATHTFVSSMGGGGGWDALAYFAAVVYDLRVSLGIG